MLPESIWADNRDCRVERNYAFGFGCEKTFSSSASA